MFDIAGAKRIFDINVEDWRKSNRNCTYMPYYEPSPPCKPEEVPDWYPEALKLYLTEISQDIITDWGYPTKHSFQERWVYDTVAEDQRIRDIGLETFYKDKLRSRDSEHDIEYIHQCYLELQKIMWESYEIQCLGCTDATLWLFGSDTTMHWHGDADCGIMIKYEHAKREYDKGDSLASMLGMYPLDMEEARKRFNDDIEAERLRDPDYVPSPPCRLEEIPSWYPDALKIYLSEFSLDILDQFTYPTKHIMQAEGPAHDAVAEDQRIREIGLELFYKGRKPDTKDLEWTNDIEYVHKCYLEYKQKLYDPYEVTCFLGFCDGYW